MNCTIIVNALQATLGQSRALVNVVLPCLIIVESNLNGFWKAMGIQLPKIIENDIGFVRILKLFAFVVVDFMCQENRQSYILNALPNL